MRDRRWSEPRVDAFKERLNGISADIKALEEYLAGCCAFAEVSYPFDDGSGAEVVWKLCEPDRWRLIYRRHRDDERPLMESKLEVRLAASRVLPAFLVRVGDVLSGISVPGSPPSPGKGEPALPGEKDRGGERDGAENNEQGEGR